MSRTVITPERPMVRAENNTCEYPNQLKAWKLCPNCVEFPVEAELAAQGLLNGECCYCGGEGRIAYRPAHGPRPCLHSEHTIVDGQHYCIRRDCDGDGQIFDIWDAPCGFCGGKGYYCVGGGSLPCPRCDHGTVPARVDVEPVKRPYDRGASMDAMPEYMWRTEVTDIEQDEEPR